MADYVLKLLTKKKKKRKIFNKKQNTNLGKNNFNCSCNKATAAIARKLRKQHKKTNETLRLTTLSSLQHAAAWLHKPALKQSLF